MRTQSWIGILLLLASPPLLAFESTKVLPKGIRSLNVRGIYTEASEKTNPQGKAIPLAEALWKPLKFKNILSSEEDQLKKTQLKSFLLAEGISEESSVGDFQANLKASIEVWAPVLSIGISDQLSLALATPYYKSSTDIALGFRTNEGVDKFYQALTAPSMNNYGSAQEAETKFQDAIGRLNRKLLRYEYSPLSAWKQSGWGDTTIALKWKAIDGELIKSAITGGLVAPTGRRDSPSILTDLPFGDGQWDVFSQLSLDQIFGSELFFNQYIKYTYQAPDQRRVAWKTFEESIEVPVKSTRFKLGDKLDAGLSAQYENSLNGLSAALGAIAYRKYGDRYEISDSASKNELQRWTDQTGLQSEVRLGYSSVAAYRRKEAPLPMSVYLDYRKQLQSRNMPIMDFAELNINLFF